MRKVIDYTVITACDSGALVDSVFEHLDSGWEPFGGVCLAYERNIHREPGPGQLPNDFEHYAQAMVKREMFPSSSELVAESR